MIAQLSVLQVTARPSAVRLDRLNATTPADYYAQLIALLNEHNHALE